MLKRLPLVVAALVVVALGGSAGLAAPKSSNDVQQAKSFSVGQAEGPKAHLDFLVVQDAQTDTFAWNVYEGLTQLRGNRLEPKLATKWSARGNAWTFTIRQGVRFHGGERLTARDVAASYRRFLNPALKATLLGQLLSDVVSITTPSRYTVVIRTKAFNPTIPAQLQVLPIVPTAWARASDTRLRTKMNGTGPYRLVRYQRGSGVDLAKFDGYWGPKARYSTAKFRFFADPAVRMAALRAGEIDMAVDLPADIASGAPKVISSPISEVLTIRLHTLQPPLNDLALRRAINMAIDRRSICTQLYGGRCAYTKGQPIISQVFGFNAKLAEYAFNPTQARQIVESRNAVGAELTFAVPVGRWPLFRELSQVIASELQAVGFKVTPTFMDLNQWIDQHLAAQTNPEKAFTLSMYGTSNDYLESSYTFEGVIKCGATLGAYCNQDVDRLYQSARSQRDEAVRMHGYEAAWAATRAGNPVVPLFSASALAGTKKNVSWRPIAIPWVLLQDIRTTG